METPLNPLFSKKLLLAFSRARGRNNFLGRWLILERLAAGILACLARVSVMLSSKGFLLRLIG
jgi:hypothetical protein